MIYEGDNKFMNVPEVGYFMKDYNYHCPLIFILSFPIQK